jgi:DNA-directed RNA polymerase specialized sigma24 family protein
VTAAKSAAEREANARRVWRYHEAARRREAIGVLRVTQSACEYAASVLANGASPAEARAAALETAFELVSAAEALRRAARLRPAERKALAVRLARAGYLSGRQIADRLGVSERTVWRYLGHP